MSTPQTWRDVQAGSVIIDVSTYKVYLADKCDGRVVLTDINGDWIGYAAPDMIDHDRFRIRRLAILPLGSC